MKLYGKPNMTVCKKVHRGGGMKRIALFRFDSEGFAEVDDRKFNEADKNRLTALYGVRQAFKEDVSAEIDVESMTYFDMKKLASERGINTYGMKKDDLIKAIKEL